MRFPLIVLPTLVTGLAEVRVSVNRIMGFLAKDELDESVIERPVVAPLGSLVGYKGGQAVPLSVEVSDASFSWKAEGDNASPSLQDLNFKIPKGSLTLVIGKVGSGKTTLLYSLVRRADCF